MMERRSFLKGTSGALGTGTLIAGISKSGAARRGPNTPDQCEIRIWKHESVSYDPQMRRWKDGIDATCDMLEDWLEGNVDGGLHSSALDYVYTENAFKIRGELTGSISGDPTEEDLEELLPNWAVGQEEYYNLITIGKDTGHLGRNRSKWGVDGGGIGYVNQRLPDGYEDHFYPYTPSVYIDNMCMHEIFHGLMSHENDTENEHHTLGISDTGRKADGSQNPSVMASGYTFPINDLPHSECTSGDGDGDFEQSLRVTPVPTISGCTRSRISQHVTGGVQGRRRQTDFDREDYWTVRPEMWDRWYLQD